MKTGSPPHIDIVETINAYADQAFDERVMPVVTKLDNATTKLESITPLLERINKRQNGQETWLIGLSVIVGVVTGYVINYLT